MFLIPPSIAVYFGAAIFLYCSHKSLLVYRPNMPPDSRKKVMSPTEAGYRDGGVAGNVDKF